MKRPATVALNHYNPIYLQHHIFAVVVKINDISHSGDDGHHSHAINAVETKLHSEHQYTRFFGLMYSMSSVSV